MDGNPRVFLSDASFIKTLSTAFFSVTEGSEVSKLKKNLFDTKKILINP